MKIKKPPSQRQLAANRLNAQKSTGPKTAEGKAIASRNSFKYTALAKTILVSGHEIKESAGDFKKLCADYYERLAPVGPLEELAVTQIVAADWRMRRALQAESGEIALNVDKSSRKRKEHNPLLKALNLPETALTDHLISRLSHTSVGCNYIVYCLRGTRSSVEREGELTGAAIESLDKAFRGQGGTILHKLRKFRVILETNPGQLDTNILREEHQTEVFNYLDQEIIQFGRMEERLDSRERIDGSRPGTNAERETRDGRLRSESQRWTQREIKLLGRYSDGEVARRLRRKASDVRKQRLLLQIPSILRRWTAEEDRLLGTKTDSEIAKLLGRKDEDVNSRRRRLGIPCLYKSRPWTKPHLSMLGVITDEEIVRHTGHSLLSVRAKRIALGLRKPGSMVHYWNPDEDALLGTMPDAELARRLGRTPSAVTARRLRKGIAPFFINQARI